MRPSKHLLIVMATALGMVMSAPQGEAAVKTPPAKAAASKSSAGKSAPKTSKKGGKRLRTGKKVPYILAPKTPEMLAPEAPHRHHFSPEFVEALARGDLSQAYRHLLLEEASDKVGYMINQVLTAQGKGTPHGTAVSPFDRATAWHNLYLFLARQGQPAPKFVKEAAKYYKKAARKPRYADRANVLLAALYATAGDTSKSEKYFGKVELNALTHADEDYNGLEYLATYYAAAKQTQKALTYLDLAYKLKPGPLLKWLHVGDDFWAIEEDPLFQEQVAKWQTHHKQMLAQLQRDKSSHGARKKAALTKKTKKKKASSSPRKRGSRK